MGCRLRVKRHLLGTINGYGVLGHFEANPNIIMLLCEPQLLCKCTADG